MSVSSSLKYNTRKSCWLSFLPHGSYSQAEVFTTCEVQNKLNPAALLAALGRDWQAPLNSTLIRWGEELLSYPPKPQDDPWTDERYSIKDWSLTAVVQSGEFASTKKPFPQSELACWSSTLQHELDTKTGVNTNRTNIKHHTLHLRSCHVTCTTCHLIA